MDQTKPDEHVRALVRSHFRTSTRISFQKYVVSTFSPKSISESELCYNRVLKTISKRVNSSGRAGDYLLP